MIRSAIGGVVAAVFSMLAVAGCSIATAPVAYPQGATGRLDSSQPLCRVTGPPEVLAKRVFVPRGVEALEHAGGIEVRFGRDRSQCLAVEWSSPGQAPTESPCPSSDGQSVAGAGRDDEAMLACESSARGPDRAAPGAALSDAPQAAIFAAPHRDVATALGRHSRPPLGAEYGSLAAPAVLSVGDGEYLSLWMEGGTESHDLHARPVTDLGDPVGPTLDLSPPDVSVIGRAGAALGQNGEGLVVYLGSTGDEFDVFGTPIACANYR